MLKKINKFYSGVIALIRKPYLINKVLDDTIIQKELVLKKHSQYANGLPIVPFTFFSGHKEVNVSPFSFLDGGSLPTDLALLALLAQDSSIDTYFEIGTWRGESVANVAPYISKCFTLNLSNEELTKKGLDQIYIGQQDLFSKNTPNIKHLKGNSLHFDFSPYYNSCDLLFIDGDHHYDQVVFDTKEAFKMLKENGIIVWHDYAFTPEKIRWEVFHAILAGTPKEHHKNLYHVSNTMCAIFHPKGKLPLIHHDSLKAAQSVFNVQISSNQLNK